MKRKKVIVICVLFSIIFLATGFLLGFFEGVHQTIKAGLEVASLFTNITIDEKMLNDALFHYKNQIVETYKCT